MIIVTSSCDTENDWKTRIYEGTVLDRDNNFKYAIELNLNQSKIKLDLKEFSIRIENELDQSLFFRIITDETIPLPKYFKLSKESKTRMHVQFFAIPIDSNMYFGDIYLKK